jgi:hypothetical protein
VATIPTLQEWLQYWTEGRDRLIELYDEEVGLP